MNKETLHICNDLQKSISELEYFLLVFDANKNVVRGSGSKDINGILKIKTTTSISILGSRWFGIGSHKTDLEIPFDLIDPIEQVFKERLDSLKRTFNSLK